MTARSVFLLLALNVGCRAPQPQQAYPELAIRNGSLDVSFYLPDSKRGFYQGTRFDHSGIIHQVKMAGHSYYAPLHPTHDPVRHDAVSGPAGEFAMTEPMGFAEAKPGESFVKIGVGLLEKPHDEKYTFDAVYKLLRAGDWQVTHGPDWVRFEQELTGDRGWAYRYRKDIRLTPDRAELKIEHRLENSGQKTIDTDHYLHNFTLIDGTAYGPKYTVEFPFSTETPLPINGLAHFRGNKVIVDQPLGPASLWAPVFEGAGSAGHNGATVRNHETGAWVRFTGDAPITKMIFWAVERAVCPEPFIQIVLTPGQSKTWSTRYEYGVGRSSAGG